MEQLPVQSNYIATTGGNKVNKKCGLYGMVNIKSSGKCIFTEGTVIRGDLAQIKLGIFTIVMPNTVIRPPPANTQTLSYLPIFIGNHVYIGENSVVQANDIGSYVYIGKNCVIGPRCKLRDCCHIADNTVLPADTTVPSFTRFSGNPGRFEDELPESTEDMLIDQTVNYYLKYCNSLV
jgi:dynactin-5